MLTVPSAADFMRRNLIKLHPGDDVLECVGRLVRANISGAPVVAEGDHYLGVLSEKCCITALTEIVEAANEVGLPEPLVRDFMTCDLITLSPDMCVFAAIDHLLAHRISGAPVTDAQGRYMGIFSEKTAMRVLAAALHDGLPGTHVEAYMNVDRNRLIGEHDPLTDIAHKFQATPYRRLPVLKGQKLAGQVSRRDVLGAEHRLAADVVIKAHTDGSVASGSDKLKAAVQPKLVDRFMDRDALTATSGIDMLGITQAFLNSPYRRLPIVDDGKLVGQVSRRDLLEAAASILRPKKTRAQRGTLYLSLVSATAPPSIGS